MLEQLKSILNPNQIDTSIEAKNNYGSDHTEDLHFDPDVVLFPESVTDVSNILKFCFENNIPVTPRGAGTGLSGGALPIDAGVLLSMERMNKILEIDSDNFTATLEPGVINEELRIAVEKQGLFYPPDPASKGSCFMGGNVAHNSGGPKAVKYGITSDYIMNLEVVLPNGDVIWTGANTRKNSTGYNLTALFVGSEGTLGVVTKIVCKLISKPKLEMLLLASFKDAESACEAVAEIMKTGVTPSALELMEVKGIEMAMNFTSDSFPITEGADMYMIIELDGNDAETMFGEVEQINEILENRKVLDVLFADNSAQKETIWKIRRSLGEAVKANSTYKEEDTVVPRASLPALYSGVKEIGVRFGFESVCYGHAGDGNLHVNILKSSMTQEEWDGEHLENGIREIFKLCKSLNGTISGEHGIGYVQRKYMNIVMSDTQLGVLKAVKKAFDPKGIMNPQKIFE
jgi:glycolate oxidase